MRPGENYQFGICRSCGVQFVRPPGNEFAPCSFFSPSMLSLFIVSILYFGVKC